MLIALFFISVWLLYVNYKLLQVTKDIHNKTRELFKYTKKTYEVLGGEEGLTTSAERFTVIQMESSFPQDN